MKHSYLKKIAAIICTLSVATVDGMEKPKKDSPVERFWQEKAQSKIETALSPQEIVLLNQTVKRASKHKSLKGKALKDYVLKELPLSKEDAKLLLAASCKTDFAFGAQYAAYALVKNGTTINTLGSFENSNLANGVCSKLYNEMSRQAYLIEKSFMHNTGYYLSLRELADHGCIPDYAYNYEKTTLCIDDRLHSLDGLDEHTQLKKFRAWDGRIETIEPSDTHGLTQLEELSLKNNRLRAIPGIIHLTALIRLDLCRNRITDSQLPYLQGLCHLTDLDLFNNSLTSIEALSPLTALVSLDIGKNGISSLTESELRPFQLLTHLCASYNYNSKSQAKLCAIDGVYQLTNLKKLDLRENGITEIKPEMQRLSRLAKIDLNENDLPKLGALVLLPNLEKLDICHNKITNITPAEIAALQKLTQLESLYLGGNHIPAQTKKEITQALSQVRNLDFQHI